MNSNRDRKILETGTGSWSTTGLQGKSQNNAMSANMIGGSVKQLRVRSGVEEDTCQQVGKWSSGSGISEASRSEKQTGR